MKTNNSNIDDKSVEVNKDETIVTKSILWKPMKIVQVYLIIVFILFVFGPWPWPISDKILVNLYIINAQLLLLLGYYISMKSKHIVIVGRKFRPRNIKSININKIIGTLFFISMILFIPTYMERVGIGSFNIKVFIDSFINGLLNPGKQYHYKLGLQNQASPNKIFLLITILTSPFRWLLFPLTIIYWDKVNFKLKIGIIILFLLDTVSWISIGTNKGIFDNIFILAFSLLIKMSIENKTIKNSIIWTKSKLKIMFFSITSITIAITYFFTSITSRLGKVNYYIKPANIYVNKESLVMNLLPNFLEDIVIVISSYVTQGYYGLSLAMRESFTTTFGFGNSWFLLSIYKKITGNVGLELYTYPFKIIKYGWDPYINWHSIYTWLASDFSFIGTLLLMILIGYIFGEVWKSVLFKHNIYAIGLFILMMIMFMYFPANNQIFSFIHTFTAFWGLFILWIFTYKIKL